MLLLRWLLLRRRCKRWTALTLICHDATEQSSLTVAERWRLWLRRSAMLRRSAHMCLNRRASSQIKFVSQHAYFSLVLLLHFQLVLLKLVDFVPDQFHLLYLLADLSLHLLGTSTLVLEFGPQRIEDLVESLTMCGRLTRPKRLGTAMLPGGIEHRDGLSEGIELMARRGCSEPMMRQEEY